MLIKYLDMKDIYSASKIYILENMNGYIDIIYILKYLTKNDLLIILNHNYNLSNNRIL